MLKDRDVRELLESAASDHGGEMPAALRDRLKSIPRTATVCRDRELLYRAARGRARGEAEDPAITPHLAECERCLELHDTLVSAFEDELPAPSGKLLSRLRGIPARPVRRLPLWITDTRYATAACVVLAMFLTAVANDSAALLAETSADVGSRTSTWMKKGEEQGRALWTSMNVVLGRSYSKSRETFRDFGESCEELFHETARTLGSLVLNDQETSDGGESDGNPRSDKP